MRALKVRILIIASTMFFTLNTSDIATSTPRECAGYLGISWNIEDGATERLNDFTTCLETKEGENNVAV